MLRLALAVIFLSSSTAIAADWPQWRGPERSNASGETGLLTEWPKDGPALAWKATGLGDGVVPVSIADKRVFTTGNIDGKVVCIALAEADGKKLWSTELGMAAREMSIMRWLIQAAPTIDGDRVYVVTTQGDYAAIAADTGKVIWRKHYMRDFDGKKGAFGYCDYPLADGDRLIVCPGGSKSTVAALDRATGRLIWSCPIPGERAQYSPVLAAEIGGVKQYVVRLTAAMYGLSSEGTVLWTYHAPTGRYETDSPIIRKDQVFYASGTRALAMVSAKDGRWQVEETYRHPMPEAMAWLRCSTRVGDLILTNTRTGLACTDWKTGELAWVGKLGQCTYTVAGGHVFIRTQAGKVISASIDAKEFRKLAEFTPRTDTSQPAWTFPVVSNGRLYVRNYDSLLCYDIRDPEARKKKAPDAVFVPTPSDVVAKMLELAAVRRDDVVYDLGSGDGRIVIAAAKAHGCKAVGVEIDEELVAKSRKKAKEAGVEKRVTFEHDDLFEADFSRATVLALYILPSMSQKLIPKIDKLAPGTRVVCHVFAIPGAIPEKVVKLTSEEDDVERPIYLYTVPLRMEKK